MGLDWNHFLAAENVIPSPCLICVFWVLFWARWFCGVVSVFRPLVLWLLARHEFVSSKKKISPA